MEKLQVNKEDLRNEYAAADDKTKSSLVKLFGKGAFENDIMEIVFSMETALAYNGVKLEDFLERTKDMDPFDWSNACRKEFAYAMNQHVHLTTEDDWFYPYYRRSGSGFSYLGWSGSYTSTYADVGSRLCVNTSDKAIHMDKCIGHIIKVGLIGEHTPETKLLQHPKTNKS